MSLENFFKAIFVWCPKHRRCGFNDKIPSRCEVRLCTFCTRSLPVSYLMQLRANFCQCPTSGSCSCALWGLCRSQQAFLFFCSSASGSSAIIRHYVEEAINGMEAGRLPSNCGENLRGRLRVPQTSCPSANPFLGKLRDRLEICQKIYTTEDFRVKNLHRKRVIFDIC